MVEAEVAVKAVSRGVRTGILLTSIALLVAAFAESASCGQTFDLEIPNAKSYFPLTEDFASVIRARFQLKKEALEEGLYYTDQQSVRYRFDVMPLGDESEVSSTPTAGAKVFTYEASYLTKSSYNEFLYGSEAWKRKFIHRVRKSPSKPIELIPFDEFKITVRWVNYVNEDAIPTSQLWIVRPNGERWMLYEEPTRGRARSYRVTGIPSFFLPVGDGVIALNSNFRFYRAFQTGRFLDKFEFTDVGKETEKGAAFTVATRPVRSTTGDIRQMPLLVHQPGSQKILFAGWQNESAQFPRSKKSELSIGQEVSLFLFDQSNDSMTEIGFGDKWPFHLNSSGIFLQRDLTKRVLHFREFDWSTGVMAESAIPLRINLEERFKIEFPGIDLILSTAKEKFTVDSKGNPLPFTEKKPFAFEQVSKEAFHQIMLLDYPPDLLHSVATMKMIPRYHIPKVNEQLAIALGRKNKTWALMIYDDGEYPEDLLGSFLWQSTNNFFPVAPSLEELSNAFWFSSCNFREEHGHFNRPSLQDAFTKIRDGIDGRQAIAYLQEFPSSRFANLNKEALSTFQDRMRNFDEVFGPCIHRGNCRVVTSMRKTLYQALKKHNESLFVNAEVIDIPEIPESIRFDIAGGLAAPAIKRYSPTVSGITQKALQESVLLADSLHKAEGNGAMERPGYYEKFFEDLAFFANTSFRRNRTATGGEINEATVAEFKSFREGDTGRWQLKPVERAVAGYDNKVSFLLWTRAGKEPKDALTEDLHEIWANNNKSVITSNRVSHAIILIPTTNPKQDFEAVDLLEPGVQPSRILTDLAPIRPALHSKGFFGLIWLNQAFALRSFVIHRSNSKNETELPGKIYNLRENLSPEAIKDNKVKIRFVGDTVRVIEANKVMVYGLEGKLSEEEATPADLKNEEVEND